MNEQTKKIETLTTDVDLLQKQNSDLQAKSEKAVDLERTNTELVTELKASKDDAKAAQGEVQILKATLATKAAVPTVSNDKTLQEKYQTLEEKHRSTETALAEWTELAKVCPRSFT
jgi:hypothetical protein